MANCGRLILFSGPSGVGKDTLLDVLFEKRPLLRHSVSVTTRNKRDSEVEGKDYYFISVEKFNEMLKADEILEYNKYGKHFYGTPKKPIDKWLKEGVDVILKIDVHGFENVKKMYSDKCISIFILPPSLEVLEQRLRMRGTETAEDFIKRMEIAVEELKKCEEYDYRVINDSLEKAAEEILTILDK
ncbi:MAG: guanylate kinase [Ruminococcaceae bacterium]|nr:guanylate kinase [Oscillospiraceae bacterium]